MHSIPVQGRRWALHHTCAFIHHPLSRLALPLLGRYSSLAAHYCMQIEDTRIPVYIGGYGGAAHGADVLCCVRSVHSLPVPSATVVDHDALHCAIALSLAAAAEAEPCTQRCDCIGIRVTGTLRRTSIASNATSVAFKLLGSTMQDSSQLRPAPLPCHLSCPKMSRQYKSAAITSCNGPRCVLTRVGLRARPGTRLGHRVSLTYLFDTADSRTRL